jgi:hypothetical protein
MRIRRILFLAAGLSFLIGRAASAQDAGKVGVSMGYPSIGLIWHASEKVAIRPELSFGGSSTDGSSGPSFTSNSDSWAVGTGVSALFYLGTHDRLKTYVSPRYTYGSTSSESTTSGLTGITGVTGTAITSNTSKTTSNAHAVSGSFGADYRLSDKFSAFGEIGFGVSWAKTTSSLTSSKGTSWGTRTGVGVIFYP